VETIKLKSVCKPWCLLGIWKVFGWRGC